MSQNNIYFQRLPEVDDLSGLLEDIFEVKLDISGGWGYDNNTPVIVHTLNLPIDQFLYTFANMKAHTEMNMFLDEKDRYNNINVKLIEGKQIEIEDKVFDMITFEISAIKEDIYLELMKEYEENYEKNKDFDLDEHLQKKDMNTITVQNDIWFYGLEDYYTK